MAIRASAALWSMVSRPIWSDAGYTFCLISLSGLKMGYRFLMFGVKWGVENRIGGSEMGSGFTAWVSYPTQDMDQCPSPEFVLPYQAAAEVVLRRCE